MITIIVILARIHVPTSYLITIHAIVVLLADKSAPIVLGQESTISLLPGFILDIDRIEILLESR